MIWNSGNLNVTKYLVGNGADVNAIDNKGNTALHSSAQFGNGKYEYSNIKS